MIRALFYAACLTVLACGPSRGEDWAKLEPYRIDRFEVALPSGGDWFIQSGEDDRWFNLSRRIRTAEGDLYAWVAFEVNNYPKNRYDWLPTEIAREVRDAQAMALLKEADEFGKPLAVLEYREDASSAPVDHWLVWARQTYIEQLGREVPEYQELHVFLPDDHAADFAHMDIYFGIYCLANCTTDYPSAELFKPILSTVTIKPFE